MKAFAVFLILVAASLDANAWLWGFLGRSAAVRATVARAGTAEAASGGRLAVGSASRAGHATRDFTWIEKEIGKSLIQRAIRGGGYGGSADSIDNANCLSIEFDGHSNYVANYCGVSVEILQFAQHDPATGAVFLVNCNPACVIHPDQYMQFPPLTSPGPFVSAYFQQVQSPVSYTPPPASPVGGTDGGNALHSRRVDLRGSGGFTIPPGYWAPQYGNQIGFTINGEYVQRPSIDVFRRNDGNVVASPPAPQYMFNDPSTHWIVIQRHGGPVQGGSSAGQSDGNETRRIDLRGSGGYTVPQGYWVVQYGNQINFSVNGRGVERPSQDFFRRFNGYVVASPPAPQYMFNNPDSHWIVIQRLP